MIEHPGCEPCLSGSLGVPEPRCREVQVSCECRGKRQSEGRSTDVAAEMIFPDPVSERLRSRSRSRLSGVDQACSNSASDAAAKRCRALDVDKPGVQAR